MLKQKPSLVISSPPLLYRISYVDTTISYINTCRKSFYLHIKERKLRIETDYEMPSLKKCPEADNDMAVCKHVKNRSFQKRKKDISRRSTIQSSGVHYSFYPTLPFSWQCCKLILISTCNVFLRRDLRSTVYRSSVVISTRSALVVDSSRFIGTVHTCVRLAAILRVG